MKNLVIGLALGIIIGGGSVAIFGNKPAPTSVQKNSTKSINKLPSDLEVDLQEYVRLKDMEEKYKKADEILGKVMLLFLANVGYEMEKNVQGYFNQPLGQRVQTAAPSQVTTPRVEAPRKGPEVVIMENKTPKFNSGYKTINLSSEQVNSEVKSAADFLTKKVIKKPFDIYKKSKSIHSPKLYGRFSGKFKGQIFFTHGKYKGQIHDIEMESNFYLENEKLKGEYIMNIANGDNVYSRNRGTGANEMVRLGGKNPLEIFLNAAPDAYIQTFVVGDSSDTIYGNYYEGYEYAGMVKLYRD